MQFDAFGWAKDPINPLVPSSAYTLFSAEGSARIDIAPLAHKARTFFATALEIDPVKAYPEWRTPRADAMFVDVKPLGKPDASPTRVFVVTWPLDDHPAFRGIGEEAAQAIGGAGMDVLVARAKRIWQVSTQPDHGPDAHVSLRVAAILASVLLAPIVPPEGRTIYGVKGARERLEKIGNGAR